MMNKNSNYRELKLTRALVSGVDLCSGLWLSGLPGPPGSEESPLGARPFMVLTEIGSPSLQHRVHNILMAGPGGTVEESARPWSWPRGLLFCPAAARPSWPPRAEKWCYSEMRSGQNMIVLNQNRWWWKSLMIQVSWVTHGELSSKNYASLNCQVHVKVVSDLKTSGQS